MERHITIRSGDMELAATLHYPYLENDEDRACRHPLILICHGFVGNRIGANRLFVKAARKFSEAGYLVLRFDYGGCGESTGDYGSTGLHSMIEQTRHVLDYALNIDWVDPDRIIVLGHSLGGAVALLTAARDKRIRTLVLWSPVAHPFNDIVKMTGKSVYEECVEKGSAEYLGYNFKLEFFQSLTQYHPFQDVRKFFGDVLLVHGTSDDILPVDYSYLYQKLFWLRSEGQCEKEIIMQGDHLFSTADSANQAVTKTVEWLRNINVKKKEWHDWTI